MSHQEIEIPMNHAFSPMNPKGRLDDLVIALFEISGRKPKFLVKEDVWASVWNNFDEGKTSNCKPETENAFFVATVAGVVCFKKAS